jgi:hypothetical protein
MRRAALLLVVLLAGCMDVIQEIWIGSDGSGHFHAVYTFDADSPVFKMPGQDGKDPLVSIVSKLDEVDAELRKDPAVRHLEVKADKDGERPRLTIDIEVADATTLPVYIKKALQPKDPTGRERAPPRDDFTIEKTDGGTLVFVQKQSMKPPRMDDQMREMLAKAYKDHTVTTRVHGPRIVSSNGTVSGDMVEWMVKLAHPEEAPAEMRAEIALGSPVLLYAGVGAGGAVVLVVVSLVLANRKSKRADGGAPRTGTRRRPALRKRKNAKPGSGEESEGESDEESG